MSYEEASQEPKPWPSPDERAKPRRVAASQQANVAVVESHTDAAEQAEPDLP